MIKFKEETEIEWNEIMQAGAYITFMLAFGLGFATCLLVWLSYIYGEFIITI